jgi:PHP family Zn ribbon phosphoesterase
MGGVTPEGRQKLADAMKKRWAAKRAGAVVKKAVRKRATKEAAQKLSAQ